MTRQEAMTAFLNLVTRHGLQWTAAVPASAYEELARINQVLTEQDRREALGLRRRR
jgi:hypothetical protein